MQAVIIMALGSHNQAQSYPHSRETIWPALVSSAESLGWKIKNRQEGSQLTVQTGMSPLCLLGIKLDITLRETTPVGTDVSIAAKAVGQIVDYGSAKRETERLFATLQQRLSAAPPYGAQSAPSQAAQCLTCHRNLAPTAKFCPGCGAAAPVPKPPEMSLRCSACGATLRQGKRFCASCGAPAPAQPATPLCSGCSAPLHPTAKFCTLCGTATAAATPLPPSEPVCSHCSQKIRPGAKFCTVCGTPVTNEAVSS